jgi:hypothetical protein
MANRIPGSREADAWLSDRQLTQCAPSEDGDRLHSPIPTQMVSNGEYMPHPQTEQQKRVEARIAELADQASKRLGMSRRRFLATSGGMAAAFLAMNEVFGRFFDVSQVEMFEAEAFAEAGAPRDLFVLDDQLHTVRGTSVGAPALRAIAQGPTTPGFMSNPFNPAGNLDELGKAWGVWNPALVGLPLTPETFQVVQFIKDMFFDSQMTVGVLSNVTAFIFAPPGEAPRPPKNLQESFTAELLTAEQTVAVRNFVNDLAESRRLLAHGLLYTGVGNLDYIRYQAETYQPDSWKGYNVSFAAKVDNDPESLMRQWRLDDELVAYPTYEVVTQYQRKYRRTRPGFGNICVHKGLSPGDPDIPERGNPTDVPKAARDWPNLNFIIYHSCLRPSFFMFDALQDVRSGRLREGVPDIDWTTEFAQLASPFPNVFGEIGTTFASTVVTFPTVCAHVLGQLMKYLGPDRIVFGSDSPWYGTPQWQIEALWRFEIPEEMRRRYGYPRLTKAAKRRILGLNSAELYGLVPGSVTPTRGRDDDDGGQGGGRERDHRDGRGDDRGRKDGRYHPVPPDYASRMSNEFKTVMEFPGFAADRLHRMRTQYLAMNVLPDNLRYGWVRKGA